jgi:hypothetical protein
MLFEFALELNFEAKVKAQGEETVKSEFYVPSAYTINLRTFQGLTITGLSRQCKTVRKTNSLIAIEIAKDMEKLVHSFLEKRIPDYRINVTKSVQYNANIGQTVGTLIKTSLALNCITIKTVDALKVLTEYLTSTNDTRGSKCWKSSIECFGQIAAAIKTWFGRESDRLEDYDYEPCAGGPDFSFEKLKIADYYDEQKVLFLEEYQKTMISLWKNECPPDVDFLFKLNHVIAKYKSPNRQAFLSRKTKITSLIQSITDMISLCPSALSLEKVQFTCLQYNPGLFFDVAMREYENVDSKLYSRGIFNHSVTTVIPRVIPRYVGNNTSLWTTEQKDFMGKVCRNCLLDKNETLQRKLNASVWLGKGNIANAQQINQLYLDLFVAPTGKEPLLVEPTLKKNLLIGLLYCVDEFEAALEIILSESILQDRDVNTFLIDGLVRYSDIIGDKFTAELQKVMSTSPVISKLGVAAMKSLVRLVVRSRNSVDMLVSLWKKYKTYHITVACYILTALCEQLNDETIDQEPIWDALKLFVDEQDTVDINIYTLVQVLVLQAPKIEVVDSVYHQYQKIIEMHPLFVADDPISTSQFRKPQVCVRFFELLFRLYKKQFKETTVLSEKLQCLAISSFATWFGINNEINTTILETILTYCESVCIPLSDQDPRAFLMTSIPSFYNFISGCVGYYAHLQQYNLPTQTKYVNITDIFHPFIQKTFANSKLESVSDLEKYSDMCKIDWILSLYGMKRRVFEKVDENEVAKKTKIHELLGRVYSRVSQLPK